MAASITSEQLQALIQERLGASHVQVEDLSGGCGQAFQVVIVSSSFEGKNMLSRHRLVNSALKDIIAAIHAFTQKDYTPAEFEKLNQ